MIRPKLETRSPKPVAAASIAIPVAALLSAGRRGIVLATFARSAYLDLEGTIVAVVAEELLNGPLNVVLAEPTPPFDRLIAGSPVTVETDGLRLEGWPPIAVQSAARWDPRVHPWKGSQMPHVVSNLDVLVGQVMAEATTESLEPPRIQRALRDVQSALRARSVAEMAAAAAALAGLGGGLTPTGDDVLVGVLLALAALPEGWSSADLRDAIDHAGRTTQISAAYLRAAARGEASEAWQRLLAAMAERDTHDVVTAGRRVLAFGETSGTDMLSGFVLAMHALIEGGHHDGEDSRARHARP